MASAQRGDAAAARQHFDQAEQRRAAIPAGTEFLPTVYHGVLFIDRVADVEKLAAEAKLALAVPGSEPRP